MRHVLILLAVLASTAHADDPPWYWVATPSQAWRVPRPAFSIAVIDDGHAVASTRDALIGIDLATGAVDAPVRVLPMGELESIAYVDGRLLGFGLVSGKPAAWELELTPPGATPIPIVDAGGAIPNGRPSVTVSPDGTKLLVCSSVRGPTVRDATTLAVLASATGAECTLPRFVDDGHVVIGTFAQRRVLDIATGAIAAEAPEQRGVTAGPGGRTFRAGDDRYVIAKAGKTVREARARARTERIQWSRTGAYVVGVGFDLGVRPAATTGVDRTISLPIGAIEFDVGRGVAVALVNDAVVVVSLVTGKVATPEGHLQRIQQVAPRGGSVLSVADKVRVWRDGTLVRTIGDARALAVGGATDPVVAFGFKNIVLWDPDTNAQQAMQPGGLGDLAVARDGDAFAFSTGQQLWRATTSTPPQSWLTLRDGWSIDEIDRGRHQIAVHDDKRTAVVNVDARTVATVAVEGLSGACEPAQHVRFAPDGKRFAVDGPILFDANGKLLGEVTAPRLMRLAWDFLPTGELVIAGSSEIVIFDPATRTAIGWRSPISEVPVEIGVDPAGRELAVGYDDGALLWLDLAALRAHATPRPAGLAPVKTCRSPRAAKLDQIIAPAR